MFDYIPPYDPTIEKCGDNPKTTTIETEGIQIGRGNTASVVDPETVFKLALMGATNVEIADWYGVTEQTIRYRFNEYLQKARSSLKIKLRRAQLKVAIENENPTMLIWLGKQILAQSDQPHNAAVDNQVLPWLTEDTVDLDEIN